MHSISCRFYSNCILPFNRVDFENIKEIPILVLDVNEDFKNDKIKQEYLIDKVSIGGFLSALLLQLSCTQ